MCVHTSRARASFSLFQPKPRAFSRHTRPAAAAAAFLLWPRTRGNKTKTGGEHILMSQLKILYIYYSGRVYVLAAGAGAERQRAAIAVASPQANVRRLAKACIYTGAKRMLVFLRRSSCARHNDHNAQEWARDTARPIMLCCVLPPIFFRRGGVERRKRETATSVYARNRISFLPRAPLLAGILFKTFPFTRS